ncbi:class I SAM-dependent methyltransferase [Sansalvadorimonas sp. 2012CJ34-2]|uniref:Class I SAM-dependent methyltransferase n=1 Tax=Parendozoicomonas callyspongiae TaxID=2942213 RepID=A0ABT0PB42_9GAMM|nr:class I SAM-dependent methyltransferase [Sansalvadorimonas sp. 2012CJ34-2]MCL6268609.1 class I SAM-dependent methyltransferase [Sansalvadorimonas sp. 2012CJ34-2]
MAFLMASAIVAYTIINGIGPTPTNGRVIRQLDKILPEKADGDVMDLGAGWGRVAIYLARRYLDNRVLAIENCPPVWLVCWIRAKLSGNTNLTVKLGNIYKESLEDAGLVYCYLYPGAMKKLAPQLRFMPPRSVIISNTFSLPDYEVDKTCQAKDVWKSPLYRYRLSQ